MTTINIPYFVFTLLLAMTLVPPTNASSSLWRLLRHGVRGEIVVSSQQQSKGLQYCSGVDCTNLSILGTTDSHSDPDTDSGRHISWKDQPQKGKCFDSDVGYAFDCRLVEILNDGLVLIEDLRAGGVFAAQPKSQYSTRKKRHPQQQAHNTPPVMMDHHSATEDFRTNIQMNLEGL